MQQKHLPLTKLRRSLNGDSLDVREKEELKDFVNLLDNVCSCFAPHERLTSARYLLIDCVCRKYELEE
ncbi:DUF6058 family natural product biosynthesis protein [Vibrio coralliirubri]|uniref:DUF6058 family natural product biosynthesis protein n=1 Tax=Vibrio coralliirubri TaxID=1516159 RepID=UPI001EE47FCB|nr:DUF6058 family natural product biosynthesis protein [Vibrio coralliirubri]